MSEQTETLTREDQAKRDIGRTEFSGGVKWMLLVAGLATLFGVPAGQAYREMRTSDGDGHDGTRPQCLEIFQALPRALAAYRQSSGSWRSRLLRSNAVVVQAMEDYEKDVQAESFLTRWGVPWTQEMLIYAGSGNEKGYVGRDRWLFYRPGIDYCTGPGFLDPQYLARETNVPARPQPARQPDPRAAIFQFQRQLAERNIRLVVMPVPGKATIHPERFSSRYGRRRLGIHNPSYRRLLHQLEAEGVLVCDVTDALVAYRQRTGNAAYLATDTHWRPAAMELAAEQLARLIEEKIAFDTARGNSRWRRMSRQVTNLGDIASMLKLRPNQTLFDQEEVTIHPVVEAVGTPWQPDSAAEVLLLGDSFANIYSLQMMNWGAAAGLAEQLSYALGRSVDTITRNDQGAFATRELLGRELSRGADRLAGKKVVVWQFAARELLVGDWKLLDMTPRPSTDTEGHTAPSTANPSHEKLIVSGTIAAKSAAPRAGQIPYAHHIFTLDLVDLQVHGGHLNQAKVAVYLFSMRDRQNTPAFSWPVGKRVKLRLRPWKPDFFRKYGRINRTETNDSTLENPWWGEVIQ